jgi:hypothetical protein
MVSSVNTQPARSAKDSGSDEEPGKAVHPCRSRGSSSAVVDRQLRRDWADLPKGTAGTEEARRLAHRVADLGAAEQLFAILEEHPQISLILMICHKMLFSATALVIDNDPIARGLPKNIIWTSEFDVLAITTATRRFW